MGFSRARARSWVAQVLGPLKEVLDENHSMRVLASVELLSKLSEDERAMAVKLFSVKAFPTGSKIIEQGDDGSEFFIMKSGHAKVCVAVEGSTSVLKECEAGDYFGEMALLETIKRTATVVAADDVECFVLSRADFDEAFGNLSEIMSREATDRQKSIEETVKQMSRMDIKFSDLKEVAVLGSGTFGRVKLVMNKDTEETFAMKALHKSEIIAHNQESNVMNEKNIMLACKHPFILRLFNTYKDNYRLYMLLEFVQGGELFTVVHTPTTDGVPMEHARFYAAAIVMGVGYLHSQQIAYRDLKPENTMINLAGYPKIVDFGFAKVITNKSYTLCGTPEYLAPEIVFGRGHNKGVDWWAIGILIYEMIAGYSTFADPYGDQAQICQNIKRGKIKFSNKFDAASKEIITKLLTADQAQRLGSKKDGAQNVRKMRFFNGISWDKMLHKEIQAPWIPSVKSRFDTSLFDPYQVDDTIDYSFKDPGNGWDADF